MKILSALTNFSRTLCQNENVTFQLKQSLHILVRISSFLFKRTLFLLLRTTAQPERALFASLRLFFHLSLNTNRSHHSDIIQKHLKPANQIAGICAGKSNMLLESLSSHILFLLIFNRAIKLLTGIMRSCYHCSLQ